MDYVEPFALCGHRGYICRERISTRYMRSYVFCINNTYVETLCFVLPCCAAVLRTLTVADGLTCRLVSTPSSTV